MNIGEIMLLIPAEVTLAAGHALVVTPCAELLLAARSMCNGSALRVGFRTDRALVTSSTRDRRASLLSKVQRLKFHLIASRRASIALQGRRGISIYPLADMYFVDPLLGLCLRPLAGRQFCLMLALRLRLFGLKRRWPA